MASGAGLNPARRLHRRSLDRPHSCKGPIENRPQDAILPHIDRLAFWHNRTMRTKLLLLPALLMTWLAMGMAADMTKLSIEVKNIEGKPVDRASVVVKFVKG